jgi:hypothetical protein
MRGTYLMYKALTATEGAPDRCCTDEPPVHVRGVDRAQPKAPLRWVRKLGPATAFASTAFRTSLRRPVTETPAVGTRVVDPDGAPLGHVQDLLIGVESGSTTVAIAATSHPQQIPVLLVPDHALRRSSTPGEVVVDGRVLERALAA